VALPVFATLVAACSSTPAPARNRGRCAGSGGHQHGSDSERRHGREHDKGRCCTADRVAAGAGSLQVHADQPATATSRPGFRTRTRKGETVFCRNETPTGSRLSVENCYSAIELDQMETAAASMKDSINKTRTPCTGQACNGS
jgi:hypothetical protein